MDATMRKYGLIILARNTNTVQELEKFITEFTALVNSEGGKVLEKKYWGLSRLAYMIKKIREAHYSILILECSPTALIELGRKMRLNQNIVRSMFLRVADKLTAEEAIKDYTFDVNLLKSYTSPGGRILPRRITGFSAPDQKRMKKRLNRARRLSLTPFCDRHK